MENDPIQFENLLKRIEDYGNANIELYRHKAIDKSSALIASVFTYRIIIAGFALFGVFFSWGLALWLGEVLGKLYYGVFVMSGVYCAVAILIYLLRDKIKRSICDTIISHSFN